MVALGQYDFAGNDVVVNSIAVGAALPGRYGTTLPTVTQATNRTTGVTLNALSGNIVTNNTSLAAEAAATFTVTNSKIAINDVVIVVMRSGSVGAMTDIQVTAVAAGSFNITVFNNNPAAGAAETGAIIINFVIIKALA
jgi:hypothetical protein